MPQSLSSPSEGKSPERPLKVFVHLAADKDAEAWAEAFHSRKLVGINDETPYGYGRASRMGCTVEFSRTSREWLPTKVLRLGLRVLTGFDVIHALRQRRAMLAADVVWTHTESQYLAVAAVVALAKQRPKILGQSVWLFDRWNSLTPLHKTLYRRLIQSVDVLTVHSTKNLAVARALFPTKSVQLVPFGIPAEEMTAPVDRTPAHCTSCRSAMIAIAIGNAWPPRSMASRTPRRPSSPAPRRAPSPEQAQPANHAGAHQYRAVRAPR